MTSTMRRAWRLLLVAGACAAFGCGGGSGGDEPEPTPPAAPSGLTATAAGHSRVDLAWADRSGDETGFKIERSSTSATAGFAVLHTAGANETLWADTTVSPSTRYWYRVCAANAAGDSAWSNVADATTGPAPVAAPTDLAATATGPTSVELIWVDNSSNEDGFEVQRSQTSAAAGFVQIALEAANSSSAGDGSVVGGTTYWYRIRAYNADGTSGWSNVATVTTPPGVPGAPTGLVAVATSATTVELTWTAPTAGPVDGYYVEHRTGGGGWVAGGVASATSFIVTSLAHQTTYDFRVKAYNSFGAGLPSALATATTPSGLPGAPTGLVAVATSATTVELTWTAPTAGPVDGYYVEYRTGGGGWVAGGVATGTSFIVTNLAQQTTYDFRVRAYNSFGAGLPSALATATTPSGVPGAPTGVVATATSPTTVELAWTAPTVGPVDYYYVEYRTGGGAWISGGIASGTSFTVAGLAHQTTYDFRVTAYNAFGGGPPSAVATATTPSGLPGAPTGLAATATSPTTVELTWTAPPGGPVDGYYVEYSPAGTGWVVWGYASGTSYTVIGLQQETHYDFRVTAYNSFGSGPPSAPASATTPSGRPGAPTGLVATATSSTSVNLTWNPPTSGDPTQYSVEYRVGGGLWIMWGWFTATSVTITPLAPNTIYDFRVLAFDAVFGFGPPSNVASATTPP